MYLVGYDPGADEAAISEFTPTAPWLTPLAVKPRLGSGKNIITAFTLGNVPYLVAYSADNGVLDIYSIAGDLSLSKAFHYSRNHEPGITQGFTTLKAFTSFGQVVFMGYNNATGRVAMYKIEALATSLNGVPPIAITSTWSHQWAKGWTRFAFFQLGGSNFFLKTNTWRPNVNIDHVNDVLSVGTSEVASHLRLQDDQTLNNVEPFVLGHADPYFVTYLKSKGRLTINRFHSDCTGWTTATALDSIPGASCVTPIAIGGTVFLLVN